MIGMWSTQSDKFLYVVGSGTLVLLALPLLFVPLTWAPVLGWELPKETHLAIYFGRSLGSVVSVIALFAIRAGWNKALQVYFYEFLGCVFAVTIVVHVYGAAKELQPLPETLEIGVYAVLILLTLCFYPGSPSASKRATPPPTS